MLLKDYNNFYVKILLIMTFGMEIPFSLNILVCNKSNYLDSVKLFIIDLTSETEIILTHCFKFKKSSDILF